MLTSVAESMRSRLRWQLCSGHDLASRAKRPSFRQTLFLIRVRAVTDASLVKPAFPESCNPDANTSWWTTLSVRAVLSPIYGVGSMMWGERLLERSCSQARSILIDSVRRRSSWMPLESDTAWNSSTGGATSLVTPSTALLNRKLAIWKGPRMLKPSEIDLLRRSKKEMAEAITAVVAIEDARQSDSR